MLPAKVSMYSILDEHMNLIQQIENNEGEITPEIEEALYLTNENFQSKAISYGFVVKTFDDTADIIDREIKRLQEMKSRATKRSEMFKTRLSEAMKQFGVEKIESPTLKLSFRKSEAVEIIDKDLIPAEYTEVETVVSISKTKIKEALKNGTDIPGAYLEKRSNLQIK